MAMYYGCFHNTLNIFCGTLDKNCMTKKLKLTIDLVPASSWNQNLRSLLKPKMWENLRKETYKKYKFRCAFCKSQGRLHAHEVWDYDDKNYVQKLVNIIALCS